MNKPLKEAFKEAARVILSSIPPILVTSLGIIALGIKPEDGIVNINWNFVTLSATLQGVNALGTAITRAMDKYTHEANKETKSAPKGTSMGLIPF